MDETFHRAHRLALVQGHGQVTLEHMLFALTEDPDAIGVLSASGVVIDKLRTDVSAHLGRMNEAMPPPGSAGAQPGPDLLRIVQLAASAARQSPRKQIDGAIILAAIIGEAKSPAAGMLKAHGLTFEEVIKVLQRAQAAQASRSAAPQTSRLAPPPPPQPQAAPKPPPPPPASAPPASIPQAVTGASPEQPLPGATRATPSTEEILASVRARVKQAEPPPLSVRAPASPPVQPASTPAQAVRPAPTPATPQAAKISEATPQRTPEPDASRISNQAAARETQIASPLPTPASQSETRTLPANDEQQPKPVETKSANPPSGSDDTRSSAALAPRSDRTALEPQPKQNPLGQVEEPLVSARSSAFDALTKAPRVGPAPQPPAKPSPPPLPSAPPPQRAMSSPQPLATPPKTPIQQATHPVPSSGQTRSAAQSYAPAPHTPPQPMAPLKPAVALDIIAAARGIPGEIPVGESVIVEIRIPRDQLDILRPPIQASPSRVEAPLARTISVQLVSEIPGALAITPLSAETVWYDRPAVTAAEEGIWRFAFTPILKGKHGVTLSVHGRTVGPYGVQVDPSAVSETFEVTVRRYFGARILRMGGYVAVFVLGALITNLAGAKIAETISSWVKLVLK